MHLTENFVKSYCHALKYDRQCDRKLGPNHCHIVKPDKINCRIVKCDSYNDKKHVADTVLRPILAMFTHNNN